MIYCIECGAKHVFSQPIKKDDGWYYKCHCLKCGKNWERKILDEDEVANDLMVIAESKLEGSL